MKYKQISILLLIISILTVILIQYKHSTETILYITVDENTKHSCNKEINTALNFVKDTKQYSSVYLKGSGNCIITEPILMPSNTKLKGDSSVTLRLKDDLNWSRFTPLIGQKGVKNWSAYGEKNDTVSNIEISGFQIDAGSQHRPSGDTYFPLILFYNSYNIKIHNLSFINSRWDTIRLSNSTTRRAINSKIYNNTILGSGHEGISIVNATNFEIYNNNIFSTRTNCAIRIMSSDKFSIHGNTIGNSLGKKVSGYAGILVENANAPISEAKIFNNLIYGKNGGIVLDGGVRHYKKDTRKGVHIYQNKIYKIKNFTIVYDDNQRKDLDGGIRINGFNNTIIEDNIIEGSSHDGIIYEGSDNKGDNYQTIVKNNIIINNKRYGINNSQKSEHKFILEHNTLYHNKIDYFNTSSTTDVYKKPLFTKAHNIKNSWHHIIVVYKRDTETLSLYIDGKKRIEKQALGFNTMKANKEPLFIGAYRGIAHEFNGKIKLNIWNRALSSKEISSIYQGGVKKIINDMEFDSKTTLFNKENRYHKYSSQLSFKPNFTISTWIYQIDTKSEYQTIFNKGNEGKENYVWLYIKEDNIFAKLANKGKYLDIDTSILNLQNIFDLK